MTLRTLPPTGVPLTLSDLYAGFKSAFRGQQHVEQFKAEIRAHFGVRHCFLVSSGRAGLSVVIEALHRMHPHRNEVAVPAFTSFSVPSAVVNAGLKVALYDLDPETLSPDMQELESVLNERTLCIVVCHLYGYPCDMDAVVRLAARKGIPLIDDAAQAMGATYGGRPVGTFGEAGLFSLSRGKNISTVDGGIIVTNSDSLAEILEAVKLSVVSPAEKITLALKAAALSFLLHPLIYWIPASLPFLNLGASHYKPCFPRQHYTPFQAGIGRRLLRRIDDINAARRKIADELMQRLDGAVTFIRPIHGANPVFLRLPFFEEGMLHVSPVRGIVRSFPTPLNDIEGLSPSLVNKRIFPASLSLSRTILTLPTHHYLTREDIEGIITFIHGRGGE